MGRNGGLTIGNKVRVLSPNHSQRYEAGGTLMVIGIISTGAVMKTKTYGN